MGERWLTDEERAMLQDWWDEDTTVGVESAFPLISRIKAAAMERAWTEGFDAGEQDVFEHRKSGDWNEGCIQNPYRDSGPGNLSDAGGRVEP